MENESHEIELSKDIRKKNMKSDTPIIEIREVIEDDNSDQSEKIHNMGCGVPPVRKEIAALQFISTREIQLTLLEESDRFRGYISLEKIKPWSNSWFSQDHDDLEGI